MDTDSSLAIGGLSILGLCLVCVVGGVLYNVCKDSKDKKQQLLKNDGLPEV